MPRENLKKGLRRLRAWQRLASWWWRETEILLAQKFGLATREDRVFFLMIPLVGVLAGVLGIVVDELILGIKLLLWRDPHLLTAVTTAPRWVVVGVPALGGLVVGLLLWLAREPLGEGGGMASLIEAVALRGGRPGSPSPWRLFAAIVTVGSGGSLGREGPLIRLGASVSSSLGSRLRLPPHRIKILLGCGAAAGMAAVYNVPIGGALFAMEVILGNFALEIFGPLVVASVLSTVVARTFEGSEPSYLMPNYTLVSGRELFAYLALGILGAFASLAFTRGVAVGHRLFAALRFLPKPFKPALGGLMLGAVALAIPNVLGNGRDSIALALDNRIVLATALVLVAARLVGTAITGGSGGVGGLFTPSLAFGAMLGSAYGTLVHDAWPRFTALPGAYAAVGMAAIAAGTSHAPISAILMVAELTDNRGLILPLMVAAITSSLLARKLYPHSLYTEPLARKGFDLSWRMEEAALAGVEVGELARPDADTLRPGDPYRVVVERFLRARRQRLFVTGQEGQLLGAVSFHDIKNLLDAPDTLAAVVAHDIMGPVETILKSDERLHRAVHLFAASDFERLPVVDSQSGRFVGVLGKKDVLGLYAQEVLGRPALLATLVTSQDSDGGRDFINLPPDFAVRLVAVPAEFVGLTLSEARLPARTGCRVIEIKRPGVGGVRPLVPDAETRLLAGDDLLLMGPTAALDRLEAGPAPAVTST